MRTVLDRRAHDIPRIPPGDIPSTAVEITRAGLFYSVERFGRADAAANGLQILARDLRGKGACVLMAEQGDRRPGPLPAPTHRHPDTDAVCLIQSFYAMAIRLAERRGTNADRPRHLQKITRTR